MLGKTFTRRGCGGHRQPEDELEPLLGVAGAQGGASIQADPRSPERGQYGFLQDLVKQVAYETLSKRERKAQAPGAAQFLESLGRGRGRDRGGGGVPLPRRLPRSTG